MREQQWTPAAFDVAMGDQGETAAEDRFTHTMTVQGETWGSFGLNADRGPGGTHWIVTHLPTGYQLVVTASQRQARQFCRAVAGLTDWTSIQPGGVPPDIRDAFQEAWHRARGAIFFRGTG